MTKTRNRLVWICLLVAVLLVCVGLFVFLQKKGKDLPVTATEAEQPDISVETPYCTLYYPGKWRDSVQYEVKQAGVSFSGLFSEDQKYSLFDVIFSQEAKEAIGMISMENGSNIYVHVVTYEWNPDSVKSEDESYDFYAMQEDLNYLIAKLPLIKSEIDTDAGLPLAGLDDASEDAFVETPYGKLVYPGALQSVLYVECTEAERYTVSFWWQKEPQKRIQLFEIGFGGSEQSAYGFMKDSGTPVHVMVFDVNQQPEMNQQDLDMALSLQENVNYILENLALQRNTAGNNIEETAPVRVSDEIVLETPYGILRYPGNQENINIDVVQKDDYMIQFRYIRENGETYGLFDIIFDGTGDFLIGHSVTADGRRVEVHMNSHVVDLDDSWNEEEKAEYYSMAEGANYVFEKYEAEYEFYFAD